MATILNVRDVILTMVWMVAMAGSERAMAGALCYGFAQADDSSAIADRQEVIISIRLSDGQFDVQPLPLTNWNNQGEVREFLADETIQLELDLTPDQSRQLKALLERTDSAMAKLTAELRVQGELPVGLAQALAAGREVFRKDLDAIFLPHQKQAMEQLLVRLRLRRNGWIRELFEGELGTHLNLPKSELTAYCKRAREIADQMRSEVDELRQEYYQTFVTLLSDEQRREFSPLGEDFLKRRLPPLEAISWQLQNVDFLHTRTEGLAELRYGGLTMPTVFKLQFDGRLVHFNQTLPERTLRWQVDAAPFLHVLGLLGLFKQPWLIEQLRLSEEQLVAIVAVNDSMDQLQKELQRQSESLSSAELQAGKSQRLRDRVALAEQILIELDKILLPDQALMLERIGEASELVQGGFPFALLHGRLGRRLNITSDQKDRILAAIDALIETIERKSRAWERQMLNDLRAPLDVEQRAKLDQLLGPDLEHVPANIDLMLEHLSRPFGRQQ